jgi:hypothetical protein
MSGIKLLVAVERDFKLLKVNITYEERQQDFEDEDDDSVSWVIPIERCYYVVAPSNRTNGELLDSITSFLEGEFAYSGDDCIEKDSIAIKSVEFLTAALAADVILLQDIDKRISV